MELPASSVFRLFVTAMCLFARGFGALVAPCRGPSVACIDIFLVLEASSEPELESSSDAELPEDSESLLLLSEPLIEERVWLDFASEGDSGIDEALVSRSSVVIAFRVGASPDSESLSSSDVDSEPDSESDEPLDLDPDETGTVAPPVLLTLDVAPNKAFFASPSSDSSDSESELEPEDDGEGFDAGGLNL